MKTKKLVALVLVAVLAITTVVGTTLAYFTDTEGTITNVVELGNVDITLTENYPEDQVLMPNTELTKEVYVENTGDMNAYVRVVVAFEHSEDTDIKGGLAAKLNIKHTGNSLYEWFSTDVDHIKLGDGKWYSVVTFVLDDKMAPKDKEATLMTVGLDKDVTYEDLEEWGLIEETANGGKTVKNIKIHVAAQAVQVEGIDAENKDTSGEGKASNIDEILDLAFGDVSKYTADDLNKLFNLDNN